MRHTVSIMKRELAGYFATPVAYVFIVIFLLLSGVFTFQFGGLYERGQAPLPNRVSIAGRFRRLRWRFIFASGRFTRGVFSKLR